MQPGVKGTTKVFAVLGHPIGHTLSPVMYNAAFRELKMNSIYVALDVEKDRLEEAVKGIKALGMQGGNVTIPLKEAIIPYLDGITEEARLIGAVNTFYWKEGEKLWGDNTDGAGFLAAGRKAEPQLCGKSAVILGAGGAARAVAVALARAGMGELTLVNRNLEKAVTLAEQLEKLGAKVYVRSWPKGEAVKRAATEEKPTGRSETGADLEELVKRSGLVVNTTPLGMAPHEEACPPLDLALLHPGQLVVDLIYRPKETLFYGRLKPEAAGS